jgi:UDP-N-acetylmuramoyl-L-alanyl-D-glutamate--2,6-diaminopimelate ligase
VMEATSIGIDLERTWKLPFRTTVFTNLTRDHLDYHGTEDAYRNCKLRLFREQASGGFAIINQDDPAASDFIEAAHGQVRTYGLDQDADYRAVNLSLKRQGTDFQLQAESQTILVSSPLIGRFNASNILAVIGAARALGISYETIQRGLKSAAAVRGRAEVVPSSAPFTVIVDYAHTPDALEKILETLNNLDHHRVFTVVGAGGDRDKGKRPQMAATSYRLSDRLFLTSDNPRSEDPEAILDEMAAGLPANADCYRNADRKVTIGAALANADSGDIILIAGKGHEPYQEIAGVKHPFSDREVALEWLRKMGHA